MYSAASSGVAIWAINAREVLIVAGVFAMIIEAMIQQGAFSSLWCSCSTVVPVCSQWDRSYNNSLFVSGQRARDNAVEKRCSAILTSSTTISERPSPKLVCRSPAQKGYKKKNVYLTACSMSTVTVTRLPTVHTRLLDEMQNLAASICLKQRHCNVRHEYQQYCKHTYIEHICMYAHALCLQTHILIHYKVTASVTAGPPGCRRDNLDCFSPAKTRGPRTLPALTLLFTKAAIRLPYILIWEAAGASQYY